VLIYTASLPSAMRRLSVPVKLISQPMGSAGAGEAAVVVPCASTAAPVTIVARGDTTTRADLLLLASHHDIDAPFLSDAITATAASRPVELRSSTRRW
jgi:hypothetical protein